MSLSKKTILVVEDNLVAARVAKMLLEHLGCQVYQVEDGNEAVRLVKENHYDGICMDIGLPTISGVEACHAIRDYEAKHNLTPVPIIAVTGNYSPDELEQYLKAGMQEVIAKPLSKDKAEHFLSFCK